MGSEFAIGQDSGIRFAIQTLEEMGAPDAYLIGLRRFLTPAEGGTNQTLQELRDADERKAKKAKRCRQASIQR